MRGLRKLKTTTLARHRKVYTSVNAATVIFCGVRVAKPSQLIIFAQPPLNEMSATFEGLHVAEIGAPVERVTIAVFELLP